MQKDEKHTQSGQGMTMLNTRIGGLCTVSVTAISAALFAASAQPIISVAEEEFFQQVGNNIGDELSNLPQLRSTFVQQNPGLGLGIQGLNLLDLRGLGTQRTLVLVNGRRHVPSDILNNGVSV